MSQINTLPILPTEATKLNHSETFHSTPVVTPSPLPSPPRWPLLKKRHLKVYLLVTVMLAVFAALYSLNQMMTRERSTLDFYHLARIFSSREETTPFAASLAEVISSITPTSSVQFLVFTSTTPRNTSMHRLS